MDGGGRFAGAALPLVLLLALTGCSAAVAPLRGEGASSGAPPAAAPSPMKGRPLYSLTVGGKAPSPPAAAAPPFTVPPFSPADEIAGRWLLLFELSYPAVPAGAGEP